MRYYATASGKIVVDAMRAGRLGMIATPAAGNTVPEDVDWCADNGCFTAGRYPGDDRYLAWLARHAAHAVRCAFATAPDVVGDAAATLARSVPMLPRIRAAGYPAALVAQDGLERLRVPWELTDGLFLGFTFRAPGCVRRRWVAFLGSWRTRLLPMFITCDTLSSSTGGVA
ncbi:hypothetical protein O7627_33210 [Solwaraspora sp. WMMD1047]|uniref:hypothetical protein n=1 Tax=Solwaraspora sp. WMMD1047 TaxID=3016102 RepID=UPI0024178945|nr:hypothetical protein [Solwaraspora sp. WMMD1047]MDG4834125.1 hypothetical protein [Solwaraspora sp. WMMD1047]